MRNFSIPQWKPQVGEVNGNSEMSIDISIHVQFRHCLKEDTRSVYIRHLKTVCARATHSPIIFLFCAVQQAHTSQIRGVKFIFFRFSLLAKYINRQVDSKINRQVDCQINRQVDSQISRQVDSQISRQVDSQINRQVDCQINRQVDSQIKRQVYTDDKGSQIVIQKGR